MNVYVSIMICFWAVLFLWTNVLVFPFVAYATTSSQPLILRFLYNLYISSAANLVLATKSPAFLGKQ